MWIGDNELINMWQCGTCSFSLANNHSIEDESAYAENRQRPKNSKATTSYACKPKLC